MKLASWLVVALAIAGLLTILLGLPSFDVGTMDHPQIISVHDALVSLALFAAKAVTVLGAVAVTYVIVRACLRSIYSNN